MTTETPQAQKITLSLDQQAARNAIHARLRAGQQFITLAGAAGCGKTTLINTLLEDLSGVRPVSLMAPTAKAALRISQVVGRPAVTLHSRLYMGVEEGERKSALEEEADAILAAARAPKDRNARSELRFFNPKSIVDKNGIAIIDEASMIGKRVHEDIARTLESGAQVIYVGDQAQLRPVNDTWGANLQFPDACLDQVHRQALDNPIVAYATAVREGWGARWLKTSYDPTDWRLQVIRGSRADAVDYTHELEKAGWLDTSMITWMNIDREHMNARSRWLKGFDQPLNVGDKIRICENSPLGYVNGEVRTVTEVAREPRPVNGETVFACKFDGCSDFVFLIPGMFEKDALWKEMIEANKKRPRNEKDKRRYLKATYGACLTAHSAQGSQYDAVCAYLNDGFVKGWERDAAERGRLLYTIATRAVKALCIVAAG
jgi:exodeoxyribonuclease-5